MVAPDWGAALVMDWAYPNPQHRKGLVYLEAIDAQQHHDEATSDSRDFVRSFKGPQGERLMLEQNIAVDVLLQMHRIRKLSEEERLSNIGVRSLMQEKEDVQRLAGRANSLGTESHVTF